jgi:hypothetical protein
MKHYKYVLLADRAYLIQHEDELKDHGYDPNTHTLYELGRQVEITWKPHVEEVVKTTYMPKQGVISSTVQKQSSWDK